MKRCLNNLLLFKNITGSICLAIRHLSVISFLTMLCIRFHNRMFQSHPCSLTRRYPYLRDSSTMQQEDSNDNPISSFILIMARRQKLALCVVCFAPRAPAGLYDIKSDF